MNEITIIVGAALLVAVGVAACLLYKKKPKKRVDKEGNHIYILNLTPEAYRQIVNLTRKTEDANVQTVMRRSLSIYDALTDAIMDGWEVYLHKEGEEDKPVLLF